MNRKSIGMRLIHHTLEATWSFNCYKVMLLSNSKCKEAHLFNERVGFRKDNKIAFVATSPI